MFGHLFRKIGVLNWHHDARICWVVEDIDFLAGSGEAHPGDEHLEFSDCTVGHPNRDFHAGIEIHGDPCIPHVEDLDSGSRTVKLQLPPPDRIRNEAQGQRAETQRQNPSDDQDD